MDFNELNFWFYQIGVNVLAADTANKIPTEEWSNYQNKPISVNIFEQNKKNGSYKNGIAIIPGKVWRGPNKDKYLVFLVLDNQKAIDEVCNCFGAKILEELSQNIIVEIHKDNVEKAHLYFYSSHEFKKKSSDVTKLGDKLKNNETPAIEVKGSGEHGIAFCIPSLHKDGTRYEIIGTKEPITCGKKVEDLLFNIYKKYDLTTDNNNNLKIPIKKLFEKDLVILEGHNRHEGLLRAMESLVSRNKGILSEEKIRELSIEWNQEHCNPPLDYKDFEKQWVCAINFLKKAETKVYNDEINDAFKSNAKKTDSSNNDDVDELESVIEKIVTLIENRCIVIFRDQLNDVYALVQINGHFETLSIDSNRFERLVIMECFSNKISINKDRIKNITDIIKTKIEFSNDVNRQLLNLRIAKSDSSFYYDLANSKWEIVKISQDGWSVMPNEQAVFKRYKNNMEQVYPNKNHSPDCVDRFLNLINLHSKKDRLFFHMASLIGVITGIQVSQLSLLLLTTLEEYQFEAPERDSYIPILADSYIKII